MYEAEEAVQDILSQVKRLLAEPVQPGSIFKLLKCSHPDPWYGIDQRIRTAELQSGSYSSPYFSSFQLSRCKKKPETTIRMFLGLLDPNRDPLVRGTDPGIRIRIHTKMSRIPNTGFQLSLWVNLL